MRLQPSRGWRWKIPNGFFSPQLSLRCIYKAFTNRKVNKIRHSMMSGRSQCEAEYTGPRNNNAICSRVRRVKNGTDGTGYSRDRRLKTTNVKRTTRSAWAFSSLTLEQAFQRPIRDTSAARLRFHFFAGEKLVIPLFQRTPLSVSLSTQTVFFLSSSASVRFRFKHKAGSGHGAATVASHTNFFFWAK